MSKIASFLSGNTALVGGGVVATAVAVVALVASGVLNGPQTPDPVVEIQSETPAVAALVEDAGPVALGENTEDTAAAEVAAVEPVVKVEPAAQAAVETAPDAEPDAVVVAPVNPILPKLDTWRFDTQGDDVIAVIGGYGAPQTELEILVDGALAQSLKTDGAGQFAAVLMLDHSDQPRVLSLVERRSDGDLMSENSVIILPAQPAPVVVAEAAPENVAPDTSVGEAQVEVAETVVEQSVEQVPDATTELVSEQATPVADAPDNATVANVVAEPEAGLAKGISVSVADNAQKTAEQIVVETAVTAAAEVSQTEVAPQPVEATAIVPVAEAEPTVKSPTVLVSDAEGVRVVQPSIVVGTSAVTAVVIDAISYSDAGAVVVAGRGTAARFVQIYLNNQHVGSAEIAADGVWRSELADVVSGVYTMRVDEVDGAGEVTSRVETPFKREAPALIAEVQKAQDAQQAQGEVAAQAEDASDTPVATVPPTTPPVRIVTVQPGFTLWAIARDNYGEGPMYVRVYEANKDQISDPDLIYPGQVFTVPE